jgi:hypothetical protein
MNTWMYLAQQLSRMSQWCEAKSGVTQKAGKLICWRCYQPIRRHDKRRTGTDGRIRHVDCRNPMLPSTGLGHVVGEAESQ